jgi:hypothetical protein
MNKDKMIAIIQSDLPDACRGATPYDYYSVPSDKVNNAITAYGDSSIDFFDVIGLTDETIFGSAKRGFLFTYDGLYFNEGNGVHSYGTSFNSLPSLYDLTRFNAMLRKLHAASIEGEELAEATPKKVLTDSLINLGLNLLSNGLNSLAQKHQEKVQAENQSILDNLENMRDILVQTNVLLKDAIQGLENRTCDFYNAKESAVRLAGIFTKDLQFILDNSDCDEEEANTVMEQCSESFQTIASIVDMEDEGLESAHLARSLKRFRTEVKRIVTNDDYETDEEEGLDAIAESMTKLVQALNNAKDKIDAIVDLAYESVD